MAGTSRQVPARSVLRVRGGGRDILLACRLPAFTQDAEFCDPRLPALVGRATTRSSVSSITRPAASSLGRPEMGAGMWTAGEHFNEAAPQHRPFRRSAALRKAYLKGDSPKDHRRGDGPPRMTTTAGRDFASPALACPVRRASAARPRYCLRPVANPISKKGGDRLGETRSSTRWP